MTPAFQRILAVAVVAATVAGAWPNTTAMVATLLVDAVAFVLILFPAAIDDLTFGMNSRGGQIDAHTPPRMISGIGWVLLLVMPAVLVLRR
jgi:hypothetical protein